LLFAFEISTPARSLSTVRISAAAGCRGSSTRWWRRPRSSTWQMPVLTSPRWYPRPFCGIGVEPSRAMAIRRFCCFSEPKRIGAGLTDVGSGLMRHRVRPPRWKASCRWSAAWAWRSRSTRVSAEGMHPRFR
jgi:hypothetical protein